MGSCPDTDIGPFHLVKPGSTKNILREWGNRAKFFSISGGDCSERFLRRKALVYLAVTESVAETSSRYCPAIAPRSTTQPKNL